MREVAMETDHRYEVILYWSKTDEAYIAEVPELPGCAADGSTRPLPEPSGDLLIFHLVEPGTRFAARPSGTEPKIKFYLFARTDTAGVDRPGLPAIKAKTEAKLDAIKADLEAYIKAAIA